MVAQKPNVIKAGKISVILPADLNPEGRGSGRARAFEFGVLAASYGQSSDECPYKSERGAGSFRKAWLRGFEAYTDASERRSQRVAS